MSDAVGWKSGFGDGRGRDEEMETEEDRAPKRSRLNERKAEFLDRRGDPRFRDLHHPEKIAKQALDQREHAAAALTSPGAGPLPLGVP